MNRARRAVLAAGAALCAPAVWGQRRAAERVVVVGGGFAGATCARYLKKWAPALDVTLIETVAFYVACPMSNRMLASGFELRSLARTHEALASDYGVRLVRGTVARIDHDKRQVLLAGGGAVGYERLVVAPGIDFAAESIAGLAPALDSGRVLHAWRSGGLQITKLRDRLAEMRPGGTVVVHVPRAPFRCPPGPYERVSLIAHYLSRNNPKGKILLFDSNPDILAKRELFVTLWRERYPGMVTYEPNAELTAVAADRLALDFAAQGKVSADLVNVIPPQRAPALLRNAGLVPAKSNWAPVDFLSYESTAVPGIHVLGDSIASAPGLPKSAHMANQSGKVCAAAIAARSLGLPPPAEPVIANTCYSFVGADQAMHVAGVYRYDAGKRTMAPVAGAGGLSKAPNAVEALHAIGWVYNILYDSFGSSYTIETPTFT